jgi:hypothetical protein
LADKQQNDDPSTPSGDHIVMAPFWSLIDAIRGGAETMRAVSLGAQTYSSMSGPSQPVSNLRDLQRGLGPTFPQSPYLPAFLNESWRDYENRRKFAPFTNIYNDISNNLATRPFSKELTLADDAADDLQNLAIDIDGQGHTLHSFAKSMFADGIDKGIDWVFIDYTKVPQGIDLATERALKARPYWVKIPAERMLAIYSAFVGGAETIYHARISEDVQVQDGYDEGCLERVRVLNRETVTDDLGNVMGFGPATWAIYEKQQDGNQQAVWVEISSGPITIGEIALVPFVSEGRIGTSWKVKPALADIAHMQIEEFQQESNLKSVKEVTAFPMLCGEGVTQPTDLNGEAVSVPVGPKAVLFAPMGGDGKFGSWKFIEPSAQSLNFLKTDLEAHRTEMRNLGRQPLATANLTVVTTANVAMKAHSAVQAWALLLKHSLELAWKYTCKYLNRPDEDPQVNIHTDFGVDFEAGSELDALLKSQAQGVLSKLTVRAEFKRRGVLSDDFDNDDEEKQLAEEDQGMVPEAAIDPATGEIIEPTTRAQTLKLAPTAPAAPTAPPAPPPGGGSTTHNINMNVSK